MTGNELMRMRTLQAVVLLIFGVIVLRLAYLQLFNPRYIELARANVLRHEVLYPPRGEVLDRNGEYLVQSRACYDLMVTYRDIDREGFDTVQLCAVTGLSREKLERELRNARMRPRAPRLLMSYLPEEDKLRFDECHFRGFHTVYRTARQYPRKVGGNLLGFVGEVNAGMLKRHPEYRAGDYVGMSGVESAYEEELRGTKGVRVLEIDTHGAVRGSYMNGRYDTVPRPGRCLTSTIDVRLQLFGEELMRGKVGAVVAIEPSTGEILMMVSSPTYDPDELVGRQRGNHYMEMLGNKRQPLYNRAVKARYPPGSTFKLVQGLIGMQEGVLRPGDLHPCREGYRLGRLSMKCHSHPSPLDLRYAVSTSCNAYFCYVFRDILDNPKYGDVKEGYDVWKRYVESFGFGRKLDSDFLGEGNGPCVLRRPLPRCLELAHGALALDRSGRAGLHAASDGQPGGHRGQPRLLLHPPHRQARGGVRLARPPLLREALHDGRSEALRTHRGGHVAQRACGRHLAARDAPGPGRVRQDRHGAEPPRPRPLDVPVVCAARQSAHRHLGLCRERRLRRRGRAAHRQSDRGVLSHGHHPAARTAGGGEKHANLLSDL